MQEFFLSKIPPYFAENIIAIYLQFQENHLILRIPKKISVFVDSQELAKAVNSIYTSSIGKKYAVNPVVMRGSFHPKVILLLAEKKARIIIGSANLKLSGYYINNEIFNYVDYDIDHSEYRDIIFYAMDFFLMLHENNIYTYQLDGADHYPLNFEGIMQVAFIVCLLKQK